MDVSLLRKWIVVFTGTFSPVYVIGCVSIAAFATLLFSGCANEGVAERAKSGASFISAPDQRPDRFGTAWAAESGGFVDFSKDPNHQPGPTYPRYGSIGEP
jgi:hypothetical protein